MYRGRSTSGAFGQVGIVVFGEIAYARGPRAGGSKRFLHGGVTAPSSQQWLQRFADDSCLGDSASPCLPRERGGLILRQLDDGANHG